MKRFLALVGLVGVIGVNAQTIITTNIPKASFSSQTDFVLGVTNGTTTRLIPLTNAVTVFPNLTNWSQLATNAFDVRYPLTSQNLSNWSTLTTNTLPQPGTNIQVVNGTINLSSVPQFNGSAVSNAPQNRMNSTNYHRYDAVIDFGAINTGVSLFKVTNVTASTTLKAGGGITLVNGYYTNTATPFSAGDVGKVISIYKMGTLTNNFTTTIATYVDPNTVTLTLAPSRGESNTFGVFGIDTTTQIQNALNVVSNWSAEIMFPDGIYVVNGAAGGGNGAQLVVPPINNGGMSERVIRLKGNFGGFIAQAVVGTQPYMDVNGPIIWSTVTNLGNGGFGCVLDCQNHGSPIFTYPYNGDSGVRNVDFNQVRLENDGLNWRSCLGNNGITFGAHGAGGLTLKNCRIDRGYTLYNVPTNITFVSFTNDLGVATPPSTSAGQTIIENVQINGFYRDISKGEHAYVTGLQLESALIGVDCNFYPSGGGHEGFWTVDFEACRTNIYARTINHIIDMVATTETPFNTDWSSVNHTELYDGAGSLKGKLRIHNTTDGTVTTAGSINVQIERIPVAGGTQVTNSYINATVSQLDSSSVGTATATTPLSLVSSGNSIQLFNASQNFILFYAGGAFSDYWRIGPPGVNVGHALSSDYIVNTFSGNAAPEFVFHHDGQFEAAKSNILCQANVMANVIVLTNVTDANVPTEASGAMMLRSSNGVAQVIAKDNGGSLTTNYFGYQIAKVSGSDATTTGQALVDVTGLTVACQANSQYEIEAVLSVSTTAVTTGTKYGVQFSAGGSSFEGQIIGSLSSTASASERINALGTGTVNAYLTTSAQTGQVLIKGIFTTGGNAGNFTIQHLKVTSGTSTVFQKSFIKATRVG